MLESRRRAQHVFQIKGKPEVQHFCKRGSGKALPERLFHSPHRPGVSRPASLAGPEPAGQQPPADHDPPKQRHTEDRKETQPVRSPWRTRPVLLKARTTCSHETHCGEKGTENNPEDMVRARRHLWLFIVLASLLFFSLLASRAG